jgi:hypothetical protein
MQDRQSPAHRQLTAGGASLYWIRAVAVTHSFIIGWSVKMTVSRVPFAYTLIDKRHKPFAEGKRDVLLTPAHLLISRVFIAALVFAGLGLAFFLWPGLSGLARDYAVRNDWTTTDATIINVVMVQSGDEFIWHYIYTFQTADGRQVSGQIADSSRTAFTEGQQVPVRYLRSDPTENVYALDPLPIATLYWVQIGLGALFVYITARPLYRHIAAIGAIRAISRRGRVVPGQIFAVHFPPAQSSELDVEVEYTFTWPAGAYRRRCDKIPGTCLTGVPRPGTAVAVWWVQEGLALLL